MNYGRVDCYSFGWTPFGFGLVRYDGGLIYGN